MNGGPVLLNILGPDLLIIGVVVVLIFGGSKIPELAKGLGQGIKNFKDSVKSGEEPKDKKDV